MKRFICFVAALCLTTILFGQAQITTKKEKLSDFRTKTTKIVLSGNISLDSALKEAAKNSWTISPFEFCKQEEFEQLHSGDDYYFLVMTESVRKDHDLMVTELKLLKGGHEEIDKMLTVATFPLCYRGSSSGREIIFMPAILHILQRDAEQALDSGMMAASSMKMKKGLSAPIYLASEDLSEDGRKLAQKLEGLIIVDSEEADRLFEDGADAIISYVIASDEPVPGQSSYVMLIDARTHRLCYLRKHKVPSSGETGFLKSDIKAIRGK